MSLGGYKFAGYKCKKYPKSEITDDELALLIHKTRLKAFISANEKASSLWHFYKNGGVFDFEQYTGVIYKIINVAYDFVSYFQYGNEDKYFAIITCPAIDPIIFKPESRGYGKYDTSSSRYFWNRSTMFNCASMSPLEDDFYINQSYGGSSEYPTHCLPLMPLSRIYITDANNRIDLLETGKWFRYAYDKCYTYYGYAIKDDRIITFATQGYDSNYLPEGLIFITMFGFNAMQLCSPNDQYNLFSLSLAKPSNNSNECVFVKKNSEYVINNCVQTLTSSGKTYAEYNKMSILYINTSCMAGQVSGVSNVLALSSCYLTTSENSNPYSSIRSVPPYLTEEGFFSKGVVDIDFLACANTNNSSLLESCGSYANGNYLLGCKDYGQNMQYYIGWDSSNPDIRQDNAWIPYSVLGALDELEIIVGIKYEYGSWILAPFSSDHQWWWSGILSASDIEKLASIGCGVVTSSFTYAGNIGAVQFDDTRFNYELLNMYSDLGETPVTYDPNNYYLEKQVYFDNVFPNSVVIHAIDYNSTPQIRSYKIKISKKN